MHDDRIPPTPLIEPSGMRVMGVMAHLGRHDRALTTWTGMAEAFVEVLGELLAAFPSLDLKEVDIGGGLPSPRDPFGRVDQPPNADEVGPRVPPLTAYAAAIVQTIADGLRSLGTDPPASRLKLSPA